MKKKLKHKILDILRHYKNRMTNKRYIASMQRYKEGTNKKDLNIINTELGALKQYWGCIPMQYFTHDFYRKDCLLTLDEMKMFIPGYYFYYIIYPMFDKPMKEIEFIENKNVCRYLFEGMNYKIANTLCLKNGNNILDVNGKVFDDQSFSNYLTELKSKKIFIKPTSGRGGQGIIIATKKNDNFYIKDKVLGLKLVQDLEGDYIFEEGLKQIQLFDDIYPFSINTLRVITKRCIDTAKIDVIAITLRMGSNGREVDNSAQGGLLIGIDIEKGIPTVPYAVLEYGCEKYQQHPDTHFDFNSLEIPNWSSILSEIHGIAERMTLLNLVGWDLALVDGGVVVIEANTFFGIDHSQSGCGGLGKYFSTDIESISGNLKVGS